MKKDFECPFCGEIMNIDLKDGFGWVEECPICFREIEWEYEDDDFGCGFLFPVKPFNPSAQK